MKKEAINKGVLLPVMLILGFLIYGCPPPPETATVNLCQKNGPPDWQCVAGGATATLTYQKTGNPDFSFTLSAQGLDPNTDYRLIYYVDTYSPWRPGKPVGMCLTDVLKPSSDGTLTIQGTAQTGDLPWPEDLNCPTGAKIWLITDADANCAGPRIMTTWNPNLYLFDATAADLVLFDDLTQANQPCNEAPVADAGPDQSVDLGSLVTLDGSGSSDPDGDPLTYSWSFVSKPAGSTATLSDPAAVGPTFKADKEGIYQVKLVVYDGNKDSEPDTVIVSVAAPTRAVNLCEKNNSWQCKTGGATATLTYNTIGNPDLNFTLVAQGLQSSTNYTLVYYPDKESGEWPRKDIICLGAGTAMGDGTLTLTGTATPGDLPKSYDENCRVPGAKIWLAPTSYVNCAASPPQFSGWCSPGAGCTQILFDATDNDWITFDDLSDPNLCLPRS